MANPVFNPLFSHWHIRKCSQIQYWVRDASCYYSLSCHASNHGVNADGDAGIPGYIAWEMNTMYLPLHLRCNNEMYASLYLFNLLYVQRFMLRPLSSPEESVFSDFNLVTCCGTCLRSVFPENAEILENKHREQGNFRLAGLSRSSWKSFNDLLQTIICLFGVAWDVDCQSVAQLLEGKLGASVAEVCSHWFHYATCIDVEIMCTSMCRGEITRLSPSVVCWMNLLQCVLQQVPATLQVGIE